MLRDYSNMVFTIVDGPGACIELARILAKYVKTVNYFTKNGGNTNE
jgi:hypothetical protein